MQPIEILATLILIGVMAAIGLLVVLLLQMKSSREAGAGGLPDEAELVSDMADATVRALTPTLRREVTEPILRERAAP